MDVRFICEHVPCLGPSQETQRREVNVKDTLQGPDFSPPPQLEHQARTSNRNGPVLLLFFLSDSNYFRCQCIGVTNHEDAVWNVYCKYVWYSAT